MKNKLILLFLVLGFYLPLSAQFSTAKIANNHQLLKETSSLSQPKIAPKKVGKKEITPINHTVISQKWWSQAGSAYLKQVSTVKEIPNKQAHPFQKRKNFAKQELFSPKLLKNQIIKIKG